MSDFDARRRIKGTAHTQTPRRPIKFLDYKCVKCRRDYMVDERCITAPGAMTSEGYVCPNCRKNAITPPPKPTPPLKGVQMRIDDVMKGAAGI